MTMNTSMNTTMAPSRANLAGLSKDMTYIAVRFAFWIVVLVYFGIVGFYVAWNHRNIDWNGYGFVALLPQLVPAACASGFVGGLMTRHARKGAWPSIAAALFTVACVYILYLVDYISNVLHFDPMIVPEISSNGFINHVAWNIPALVALVFAAPMGCLGGWIGRKYLKIPKGRDLSPKKQVESLLDVFKKPLFLLIFIIVWTPLLVPLFSMDDSVHKEYSAWNYTSSGMSQFRLAIENTGYTRTTSSVGSYSLLSRIDEPFVLVVMGPNRFYNLVSDIPFLIKFLRSGGSLLIAHEQGTTEWLLLNMMLASLLQGGDILGDGVFPLTFFMDGILRDNSSYLNRNDFPVIDTPGIKSHPVTAGVSRLVLNRASGLMLLPGMESLFRWNIVASTSSSYSWVDKDDDGMYSREKDNFDPYALGIPMVLFEPLRLAGISFPDGLPQGGFSIPVVGVTDLGNPNSSRVVVTADASMFSNQLIDHAGFDNRQFAINCIDWLCHGNKSMRIVFDESHLRPVAIQDTSASAVYGTLLDYVGFMSSNWLLAPFYPFIAWKLLQRWMPKSEEKKRKEAERKRKREALKEKRLQRREKLQRRRIGRVLFEKGAARPGKDGGMAGAAAVAGAAGQAGQARQQRTLAEQRADRKLQGMLKKSTFFAQKLAWYMEQPDFNKAIELLFNRVKRLATKKLGDQADARAIIAAIVEHNPQVEQRRLELFFRQMQQITRKGSSAIRVTRPENLEKYYYEIMTVAEYLEKL